MLGAPRHNPGTHEQRREQGKTNHRAHRDGLKHADLGIAEFLDEHRDHREPDGSRHRIGRTHQVVVPCLGRLKRRGMAGALDHP